MAYNNYFPQFYPSMQPNLFPTQQNVPQQVAPQTQNSGITWVQGESAAKSYPVASGQSILLMDSENPIMYIKSTDQSGMPMPLRIFDYTERKNERTEREQVVTQDYISRTEFDAFKDEIKAELRQTNKTTVTKKSSAKEE